jgi:hypothetical protein
VQFAALTSAQVSAIQTDGLVAIGSADIKSLGNISALSTASVIVLTSGEISNLATVQIQALTTAQFQAMLTTQIAAFKSVQVAAIRSDSLQAITTANLASLVGTGALSSAAVVGLSTGLVAGLSTVQIQGLSAGNVIGLSTAQHVALTSDQFAAFKTAQVAAIQTDDVIAIGTADLRSLGNIGSLATASVRALTTDQIQALTTTQYVALTGPQFSSLSSAQVGAIQTDDVIAIGSTDIKTLANIAALPSATVAALTSSEASALLPTQLSALTVDQVLALDRVAGISLTAAQTGALHASSGFKTAATEALLERLTPLALDLDGNGVRTISSVAGTVFDVNADGQAESVGWLSTTDAWLALDRNGNGLIDDGSELFGSGTTMPDASKALDGFAALRVLDSNQDGVIDSNDSLFGKLALWTDANSNAKTDPGELRTLTQAGILSLSLEAKPTAIIDQGNLIGLMGSYSTLDGQAHEIADVWLSVDPLGARVVDLSALDHSATASGKLARINFAGNGAGDTLKVALNDVLIFGGTDVVAGPRLETAGQAGHVGALSRQIVVSGDLQDTIQLADAANWTMTGTAVIGDASYRILTQGLAQLLVEDKVKIVAV